MCPVTCQQIGAETLVFAMVSVASDVIFMLWWVGVAFMTNLRIGISGAHGCQKLFIFCCYLQWLSHLGQLCVVFYKCFDTRLCLIYVFYSEFGTWAIFLLLSIVNRSPVSQI